MCVKDVILQLGIPSLFISVKMIINPHQETTEYIVIFLSLRLIEFYLISVVSLVLSYLRCFISFISNLNFPSVLVIGCLGNIFEVGFHWSKGRADFLHFRKARWFSGIILA